MYSKNRISSRPQGDASDRSFKTSATRTTSPRTRGFSQGSPSTQNTTSTHTRVVRQTRPYVSPTKPVFFRESAFQSSSRPSYGPSTRDYPPRGRGNFGGAREGGFSGGYDRPSSSRGNFSSGGRGGFGGGRGRGPTRGERIDHSKFIYKPDVATLEKEAKAKTKNIHKNKS